MRTSRGEPGISVHVSKTMIYQVSAELDRLCQARSSNWSALPARLGLSTSSKSNSHSALWDEQARSRSPEPSRLTFTLQKAKPARDQKKANAFNTQSGTLFVTTDDVLTALRLSQESAPQLSLAGEKDLLYQGEHAELLLTVERIIRQQTRESSCLPQFVGQSGDDNIYRQSIVGDSAHDDKLSRLWLYYCLPTLDLVRSKFWHSGTFDDSLTLIDYRQHLSEMEKTFLLSLHFNARGAINHLLKLMAAGLADDTLSTHNRNGRTVSIIAFPVDRLFVLQHLVNTDHNTACPMHLWHESNMEVMVGIASSDFQMTRESLVNVRHYLIDMDAAELVSQWQRADREEPFRKAGHVIYHNALHNFWVNLCRGPLYSSSLDKKMWKKRTAGRDPIESIVGFRSLYNCEYQDFIWLFVRDDGYFEQKLCDMTAEEEHKCEMIRRFLGVHTPTPSDAETGDEALEELGDEDEDM